MGLIGNEHMAQCCVPCGKLTAWHGKAPTTRCHNTPTKCKTSCVCVGCQKHSLVCVVLACSAAPSALLVSPPSWQSVGHVDGWLCVLMHTHHQPPNTLVPHNTHAPWACSHTTHKSHHPLCAVLLLLFSNGTNCGWFVVHGQGARCGWSSNTKHHIHTTTTMQHTWCGCGDDQCDLLLVPHHHHNNHPPMHPHLLMVVMASDQPPKRVQPSMSTLNASTHGPRH